MRMKNYFILMTFPILLSWGILFKGFAQDYPQIHIYVSPSGDDTGSGTESSPVRTMERAKELVRAAKAQTSGLCPGIVHLT